MALRCLYAASEVAGFAKTGGLADVAAALPPALAQRGIDCAVIMPLYRGLRRSGHALQSLPNTFSATLGNKRVTGRLWRAQLPDSSVPVYLVEQAEFFERDDPATGQGLYQFTNPEGRPTDYPDNSARFGFFAQAILEAIRVLDFWPDVLHLNDWQTGMAAVYLREIYRNYRRSLDWSVAPRYEKIRTLFTIHNLAYQGLFWHWDIPFLGLPWRLFTHEQLEFYGKINFLKAGIVFADRLNTVSPTYAREIQTTIYGCGLQGVLTRRAKDLTGIVNGVDYRTWDPATDIHIAHRYQVADVAQGKAACKKALQKTFALEENPRTPLLGLISRLVDQKGLDLVEAVAPALLLKNIQLVVLGLGDPKYHNMLLELRQRYPRHVGVRLALDEAMAHQIEAGADMFLMPSRYEPCGLNQLYSLKYGTVPVVRATGGLADTVVDCTPENLAGGRATGFTFLVPSAQAFLEAVQRALTMHEKDPAAWRQLQETGMRLDWSWTRSAAEYEKVYRAMTLNS